VGTDVDETWDQSADEDDESARINGILKVRGRFTLERPLADLVLKERTVELWTFSFLSTKKAEMQVCQGLVVGLIAGAFSHGKSRGMPGLRKIL
jgi:hypothetical protein